MQFFEVRFRNKEINRGDLSALDFNFNSRFNGFERICFIRLGIAFLLESFEFVTELISENDLVRKNCQTDNDISGNIKRIRAFTFSAFSRRIRYFQIAVFRFVFDGSPQPFL